MGIEDDLSTLSTKVNRLERLLIMRMTAEEIVKMGDDHVTESWIHLQCSASGWSLNSYGSGTTTISDTWWARPADHPWSADVAKLTPVINRLNWAAGSDKYQIKEAL